MGYARSKQSCGAPARLATLLSIFLPPVGWGFEFFAHSLSPSLSALHRIHDGNPSLWLLDFAPLCFLAVWCIGTRLEDCEPREDAVLETPRAASAFEAERELERVRTLYEAAARRFEELFQGLPVACFTYDQAGTMFDCNRQCEELTGHAHSELEQRPVLDTIWRGESASQWREIAERVFTGQAFDHLELQAARKDGTTLWALCSTFPLRSHDGSIPGAICAVVDITQRKALETQIEDQLQQLNEYAVVLESRKKELEVANRQLSQLAATDGLTGVANRRIFRERLDAEVALAHMNGTPLSLVMMDVDKFKEFNDSFGHQAGDQVLARTAELLKGCLRQSDLVARYGGEEFVAILPGSLRGAALAAAERMRAAIESAEWEHRVVTASFGAATAVGTDADARSLIEAADAALYAAKRAGRNRVAHANDMSGAPDQAEAA